MIKITFTRSRSARFADALKCARLLPNFKEGYSVELSPFQLFENWDNFSRLHNTVYKWSGTNIYFNGRHVYPYNMHLFYSLQNVFLCFTSQPSHKCMDNGRPGWGCQKLARIRKHLDYYSYSYWYQFGKFGPGNTWIIDKVELYNQLMSDANKLNLGVCPFFDEQSIIKAVDDLPEVINIDRKHWEIVYREDFVGDKLAHVPSGIKHITGNGEINWPELEIETGKEIDEMSDEEINELIEMKLRNIKSLQKPGR